MFHNQKVINKYIALGCVGSPCQPFALRRKTLTVNKYATTYVIIGFRWVLIPGSETLLALSVSIVPSFIFITRFRWLIKWSNRHNIILLHILAAQVMVSDINYQHYPPDRPHDDPLPGGARNCFTPTA